VARFEPFAGVRYDPAVVDLADVIAPPWDVLAAAEREALLARSPYNAVQVDSVAGGCLFQEWLDGGVLAQDDEPGFYVYRMGYHDPAGRPRQTAGVIGALAVEPPSSGQVLPHERTLARDRDDRLAVLEGCRANLSPVWGLSLATGLSGLCELPGPPDARATDDQGVHHRLWRITQPGLVAALAGAVGSAPVVIADGHHRYETALAYRSSFGGRPGDHDLIMALVVELAEEQLTVRPIHRVVRELPAGSDLPAHLARWFEPFETAPAVDTLPARMADAGALALVTAAGTWLLRPRPGHGADAGLTDAERLAPALAGLELPADGFDFTPDPSAAVAMVAAGQAAAALLLRPPTIGQIAATARAGRRMPEKSTFFHPKPRTGLVFRRLAAPPR
jgi:uncharacterized protein (DUF1015 family)